MNLFAGIFLSLGIVGALAVFRNGAPTVWLVALWLLSSVGGLGLALAARRIPERLLAQAKAELEQLGATESAVALEHRAALEGRRYPGKYSSVKGSAALALVGALALAAYGPTGQAVGVFAVGAALLCIAWVDSASQLMPDELTAPALWGALLLAATGHGLVTASTAVVGAAVAYSVSRGLGTVARAVAQREALGEGDWMLFAALGAFLGPLALPWIWILAGLSALCVAAVSRMGRAPEGFPFGPHLVGAAIVLAVARPELTPWLVRWTGVTY